MDDKLRDAAEKGDAVKLSSLIQQIPKDQLTHVVNKGDNENDRTPLHWAAQNGHAECVKLLLEANADPNKGDNTPLGRTPFDIAVGDRRSAECVIVLLLLGADAIKVSRGKQELVQKLELGLTPLVQSAFFGRSDDMRAQLAKGDDPNQGDADGPTPLHWASRWGHAECVKLLLEAKADPNKGDKDLGRSGSTPLHKAAEGGSAECVKLLLEADADSNRGDTLNQTPLFWAARNGHAGCVKLLLEEAKADPNKGDIIFGETPIYWAAEKGHAECVKLLLEAKADPNKADKNGYSPLYWAAQKGHVECVKLLLEAKADPNKENTLGNTPLHFAAKFGHAECVELLRAYGAKETPHSASCCVLS